jgi:hypothetical protein
MKSQSALTGVRVSNPARGVRKLRHAYNVKARRAPGWKLPDRR